ncbi:O-antigen ligase [Sphaerotilus hippei]|uniref:O-antigen ligase n=1 Tax=Sphaerotilus hippei TaxID=744406 RepID=A0A318GUK0_9BURK|nr:O-antigen ligase family protein [Sphaerotilus hippei]PXW91870.1 O-antigen ligase [Sphaerotilus hippei]
MNSLRSPTTPHPAHLGLALIAVALPMLLATSTSPVSTFFNQWLAAWGMGTWLLLAGSPGATPVAGFTRSGLARLGQPQRAAMWMLLGLGLLSLAQVLTPAPLGQRLVPLACLLLAAVLLATSALAAQAGDDRSLVEPLMWALLVAGGLSVLVGLVQVFVPRLADGLLIAWPTTPGRAIGNMRQPNQLSTLLMWACAAAIWLAVRRRWPLVLLGTLLAALVFGVVLTASRTGTVGVLLLALWGAIDRRLPGRVRLLMLAMLPLYALGWWGLELWSAHTGDTFYGDDQIRKTLHGDASSSRGKIWSNTLAMIAAHPWFGVGAGAFNFVWSMTPFPDRPVAFFDHSHNLPMQLAVESGLPLAVAVLGCAGWALWKGRRGLVCADLPAARGARTALFMLVVVSVHSLLEYPLWYVYFLLPTALLAGWYAGLAAGDGAAPASERPVAGHRAPPVLAAVGLAVIVGSLWALYQYWTVTVVFEPQMEWGARTSLEHRISRAQRSVLFGQHADYARVTMAEHPEQVIDQFERPLFHLLDTRLMTAYARALAARGDLERARHVAARLREFRNPAARAFFEPCDDPALEPRPFQCGPDPALPAAALWPAAAAAGSR